MTRRIAVDSHNVVAVVESEFQRAGDPGGILSGEQRKDRGGIARALDKNFRPAYDPDLAQKRVQEALRRRGRRKGP